MLVDRLRDRDLGADAVGAGREQRVGERPQHGHVEQARESADSAEHLRAVRASHRGLHQLDRAVSRRSVDADFGIRIGGSFRHSPSVPAGDSLAGVYAGPLGTPHWEASEDASRDILVALYLRDALGIVDASGLPRLLGTGLPETPPPDDRLSYGWLRWWIPLVEPDAGPLWQFPDGDDPFARAVRPHLDSARAWADVAHQQHNGSVIARMQRPDDVVIQELVAEREAELGRVSRPVPAADRDPAAGDIRDLVDRRRRDRGG